MNVENLTGKWGPGGDCFSNKRKCILQTVEVLELTYAQDSTNKRETPVVELEPRAPARCIEQVEQKARQVHTSVTEQEEHGYNGGNEIQVAKNDTARTDQHSEECCKMGLLTVRCLEIF